MNTMTTGLRNAILTGTMALLAGAAYGQVPASNDTSDGNGNTGMGTGALGGPASTNGGTANTASGVNALHSNTTGSSNTASGYMALYSNTTGNNNTASGYFALYANTTGNSNTAYGLNALFSNSTGYQNTASGFGALSSNSTGYDNTASGSEALYSNTTGNSNTASGLTALYSNTTGYDNTASGYSALYSNTTGSSNTAYGFVALASNRGSNNTALGYFAGYALTSGSNNIDIGNFGVAGESGVIRIGTTGTQAQAFVAGIATSQVTGAAVYVTSSGQLGVLASSERYKTGIASMGSNTEKLQQLRPVTFHLKTDTAGAVQYGLIAEEVDKVYPELVIRDDQGVIQGVRYDELAPMLLNEMQQQERKIEAQAKTNADRAAQIRDLKQQVGELNDLKAEMHAALVELRSKDQLVAQR